LPHRQALQPLIAQRLSQICDVKQGWDAPVYRLNESLLHRWLKRKVDALACEMIQIDEMRPVGVDVNSSKSATSTSSDALTDVSTATEATTTIQHHPAILRHALSMLSEYLSTSNFALLCSLYQLEPDAVLISSQAAAAVSSATGAKQSTNWQTVGVAISGDVDTTKPVDMAAVAQKAQDKKRKAEELKLSSSAKKLLKAGTKGMKSMTSFFAKK
jgi:hypothetical protein